MWSWWFPLYHLVVLSLVVVQVQCINRDDFPDGFFFGAGTSAYQAEGAAAEDGRTPSIWDTFTHAGNTVDKKTGDVAADQYHKYKEDVKLMHEMGLNAYRFSISWSRLIPNGRGPVNPKGLQYYNSLINELKNYGIEPHVTLLHFDLPQELEDEYEGLLSPKIVQDFTAYANVCFHEFGDRVKYWATLNEPNISPVLGYDYGVFPPGRCSFPFGFNCTKGNSTTEPYIGTHNCLLAHASAASLYREQYQAKQGGFIGFTLLAFWFEPFTESSEDIAAAKRALDFHMGWIVEPLLYGTYPAIMKKNVGSRLPSFTAKESDMLIKGSFDFIGLNHYSVAFLQAAIITPDNSPRDYGLDMSVKFPSPSMHFSRGFFSKESPTFPIAPWAMQKLLDYFKITYGNPPVMIHENGSPEFDIDPATSGHDYNDAYRANYIKQYIESLPASIRKGSNILGYFAWSFIDCMELSFGYTSRYGIYGVDFSVDNRTRYLRSSGKWYGDFLKNNALGTKASISTYLE